MNNGIFLILMACVIMSACSSDSQSDDNIISETSTSQYYFPPIGESEWETVTFSQLNWQEENVANLYQYLEDSGTLGFIILHKGRIVVEEYFNGHTQDAVWIWNSAVKSLLASTIGIAMKDGILNINDRSSEYLGTGWTSLSFEQEQAIRLVHHLSMTTGLEDNTGEFFTWTCTLAACLEYKTDPETRWAYHQGAYSILFEILSKASNRHFANYITEKLENPIGMSGAWIEQSFLQRYQTNTRSMARFGLLMLNEGVWETQNILDKPYFQAMTTSSQTLNPAYGYLWWLNGKSTYLGTVSQEVFQGPLVPNAPADMVAALGGGDQKIYIVPSKDLVVIRTGESAGQFQLGPSSFDNALWERINLVID